VLEADLLLHVVDLSHPGYQSHMDTTREVLAEIGADQVPVITVFNKIDQVEDRFLPRIMRGAHPRSIAISALNEDDIIRLREHVYGIFADNFVTAELVIPAEDLGAIRLMFKSCMVLSTDYSTEGVARFEIRGPQSAIARLEPYIVKTSSGKEQRNASFRKV
jgi:GTP-binding protein HflX